MNRMEIHATTEKAGRHLSSDRLPELNRAFKRAQQQNNLAECDRLKAEIDAVLDEALRALRLR